jgi:magnesium-transporting ATPase (P-type)
MCLNSRIVLERKADNEPFKPSGDATEIGLYRFCEKAVSLAIGGSNDVEDYRRHHEKLFEIPFNSSNKWQLSVHTMRNFTTWDEEGAPTAQETRDVIMFKGAPDVILSKCSHYMDAHGSQRLIDQAFTTQYNTEYEAFGGEVYCCCRIMAHSLLNFSLAFTG